MEIIEQIDRWRNQYQSWSSKGVGDSLNGYPFIEKGLGRWLAGLPGPARGIEGALVGTAIAGPRLGLLFWVGTALGPGSTAQFALDDRAGPIAQLVRAADF